ncbi:zf-PARP-domain-containing protein, partial [Aureobasidium melanogenum]
MPYRLELSPNNRAGCKATDCKDKGVKIMKGELRQATQITINEHQSWVYRHWGCVTPKQLENMKAECGMDMEYVDGYDELPHEFQEKVYRALDQGHVDMEDWKGDPEYNVPGKSGTGPRKTKKQKEAEAAVAAEAADGNALSSSAPEPAPKKRGRKKADPDNEEAEAPPPKKARGKKAVK